MSARLSRREAASIGSFVQSALSSLVQNLARACRSNVWYLAKDLTIVCHAVGFDPYLGFYHQPRHGRPALALDLMEPFRAPVADSAVLSAINTRMVTDRDFVRAGNSVALTADGRKAFFRAYEQRMDTLVTHPIFGYRVNYRRILEIQTRLLARVLTGELAAYPVFTTR